MERLGVRLRGVDTEGEALSLRTTVWAVLAETVDHQQPVQEVVDDLTVRVLLLSPTGAAN